MVPLLPPRIFIPSPRLLTPTNRQHAWAPSVCGISKTVVMEGDTMSPLQAGFWELITESIGAWDDAKGNF